LKKIKRPFCASRTPVYEGCADFIVDTDDKTVEEIAFAS